MGISAGIYALTTTPRMGQSYSIFSKNQLSNALIKDLDMVFGEFKILNGQEILYIGDSEYVAANVLKDYDVNEGIFSLEEGLSYLKDKNSIVIELEKLFNEDISKILEKKTLILSLDY